MKLKTVIIMLLCASYIYAQDLSTGLSVVNDLNNYPMQPQAKPAYLDSYIDPSFGTTIRRISNVGQGGTIKPMYSTTQAWNADETLMVLYERGRGHQLLDGFTYEFIRYLDDVRPDDIEQIFWDFDDPDIFYYVDRSNNDFVRYSVSNANGEVIVNFGTLTNCANVSLGNDVQMMSWDSDIFGFRCANDRVYYYQISTGQLTEFNLFDDNVRYTAPMPGASGNYFYHNRRIYNSSGNLHTNLNESNIEHSCNGRLANGDDGYFAVSFAQGPQGGCLGNLIQHNMRTGECTPLISQEQGYPYSKSGTHVSALAHKNTQGGWVAASMVGFEEDGQSLLDQELVVARADAQGNVTVCRIGHHRSDENEYNYFGEPHASISPTGTRVIFASDWSGSQDGQSIDTYVVELPTFDGVNPPPPPPSSANAVTPGTIQIDPTFEHIGILYNVSDDENLNSNLQIEFREQGNGAYQQGAVTMRSHDGLLVGGSALNANHHAGSAMFLRPNTAYDIRLTLTDPDGGGTVQTVTARTKAYPTESNNLRYVAPGNGGGNGTAGNPYRGLQAAADNAQAGTTYVVRAGNYSPFNLNTSGTGGNPITFRSETLHTAIIDGANTSSGVITLGVYNNALQHIIIDGFQIQNGARGIDAQNTQYLTVQNCRIENVSYGIINRRENGLERDQYITNNYLSGRNTWPGSGIPSERGIDVRGNRNVISFNTIENFGDGISTDGRAYRNSYAMDIHNNDIRNIVDDLVEVDFTVSNTRIYRNRLYNGRAGVSVAPVYGGPCYIFRNEMYNMENSAYKMNRGPSGLVIVHNSSAKSENGMSSPAGWQNTFFKNNVVMGTRYCFEEYGLVSASIIDDWDYNAYYSPRPGNNVLGQQWFKWDGIRYGNLSELQNGTDIETNGLTFNPNSDIANAAPPANYEVEYTPDDTDFEPTSSSNFRNNGVSLANLNDEYVTDGNPDRGAYEFGQTPPEFGANFGITPPPPPPPSSANAVTPGTIRIDPTFEHIGILYNISDDENLNSNLQIEFREQGNGAYQNGAITMRSHPGLVVDGSTYNANHHAGSAMFLEPNTTYDIRLTLTDPDGGDTVETLTASTKAYPTESNNYQYVEPGNGGGNGTSANPYRGLQTASDNAQPGTTFIVRPGTYSRFSVATDGTANAPITFRSETTHAAIVDGGNTSSGIIVLGDFTTDSLQHIIIDGLKIQSGRYGIDAQHTQYITIKNCWIEDVTWGYYNRRENAWEHDQYITNNYIEGRTDWTNGGTSHRGIDIRGNRNVISFNTIKNFDDGVSTDGAPFGISYAMDIHNNDIQNMADDLIEVDGTVSNTRIYRNRMYNARAGVSLAPVFGGPCYVFRNEMYNMADRFSAYKMNRSPAGLVIVHNSSAKITNGMSSPTGWQNTFFKNNVVMGTRYCFEEYELVSGNDDWDYNAYYSTRSGNNVLGQQWFKWDNVRYGNLSELQNGTDIETNGITFDPNTDIVDVAFPANDNTEYTPDDTDFQPTSGSSFRNNGLQLDNLNDEYVTDGQPDRGAYEFGQTPPEFGANFGVTPPPPPPNSENALTPGTIQIDPTFEHIAILYNVSGDANLNSNLEIAFRRQGTSTYQKGAITMRSHEGLVVDGTNLTTNHHAGSAMFLRPGRTYEIRLTLTDPDGGGTVQTVTATTKAYPKESNNLRYVVPGNGGGTGTSSNPYRGLQAAADNAQPGTTYIVRKGNYSRFRLNRSGTEGKPITFRSEAQHAAIIDGGNASGGVIILGVFDETLQHVIIDGLKIQNGQIGIDAQNTQYLTIKNCRIEDVTWGFYNRRENGLERDQYITNNYLKGRTSFPGTGDRYRGIDIRGNRNVVSFNTIQNFEDGISTDGPPYATSYAMDIHNNDIRSIADDLIEVDGTVSNTRVYRNRLYNGEAGLSLAPVLGGPCYVFRNEIYNILNSAYKMNRGPSGLVIVHNSSSKSGNGMSSPAGWQNTFFKNNVVIGSRYCFEEYGLVDGSTDDWDYNAYKSTRDATPGGEEWFKWDNDRYATINDLRSGTSIEDNGIAIGRYGIINADPPSDYRTEYTPADTKFQPYRAADFVDEGINLDNLNDGFVYDGEPDMGCYEYANTLPKFGANFISSNKLEMGEINFNIFPNPFTHSFNIEYHLTQDEHVSIQLFTKEGKLVRTINNEVNKAAGSHIETVNIENLPSGMYLIHLTTADSHGVQKLVKF